MNDHSNSLPPAGDDALQARIVAWVLGEASPFEAAELEKLCAENPRLRDFERRTRDLHELLVADAKPGLHPSWQLPPDKRGKITDLLGSGLTVLQPAYSSEKVNRYFSRRILLAAAACLALSVVTFPLFMSRLESRSRVVGARAPEKSVDFMPSSAGGGSGAGAGESREMNSRSTLDARRKLTKDNLSRATAEGASFEYSIPDSEALMPDLAAADGLSSGFGGGADGGGRGNGSQGLSAQPAKPSRPATATAFSPEQEKLKKQLVELQEREDSLADNSEFAGNRLGGAEPAPAPVTSAPAAPPPASAATPAPMAGPAVMPEAEAPLPEIAAVTGSGEAGGFGFRSAGGVGAGFGNGPGGGGLGGASGAGDRFGAASDAPMEGKDGPVAAAKGAPATWGSRAQQPNNSDFVAPDAIVTGGLRSGDGVINRNNIDAILVNPNNPVPGGAPQGRGGAGAKGDGKEMAENKPLSATATATDESLAKTPAGASDGNKNYFYRETAQRQAEAKGKADAALGSVEYKDADLAWTEADAASAGQEERTKSRALSTADGLGRGRDIDRAKQVAEKTVETKKSKADVAGLSLSDDFGDAVVGEKGMKQEQATPPPAGEPSLATDSFQGGLRTDLSSLSRGTEAAFQHGADFFDGSGEARYVVPPIEDPQVRPVGGMPTDQDYDGFVPLEGASHYGLAAGRGLQVDGALNVNGTSSDLWSKSLGDQQSPGQTTVGGETRFRSWLGAASKDSGNTATLSLDSLAALDAKRGENTLNYHADSGYYSDAYSGAQPNTRFSLSNVPPTVTGKPMSGGTTTWFETDATAGLPVVGTMFGREAQPQTAAPATPELPAQQMAQGGADAKRVNEWLDDPIRSVGQATAEHTEAIDKVRRSLYLAEGSYNLGKFDDSVRHYEEVIRTDPSNKAARRGLERVAQGRADYYRAAYDHTRAGLLAQVDKSWETTVLPVEEAAKSERKEGEAAALDVVGKSRSIRIPEIQAEGASVGELVDLLRMRSRELDVATADPAKKGINMVIGRPAREGEGIDPGKIIVPKLELKDKSVSEVLDEISEATGLDVQMEEFAIVLKPGLRTKGKQAEQIVDKMAEVATATEPFSTFSLHVSDASFKLAKAALDRGEQPAAESIRPEEFYNAFDYGDPGPANGEPVVCATEQCAHPAIPQRNLMRIAVRTAAAGRGNSTPLNLTLLLDSSGSMEREDRQAAMTKAVSQLAGLLKEGDTITVAGFARQPRLLADRLPGARAQELNGIIAQTPSEGGTNLEEGIKLAEDLAKRQFNPAAQNRIVLFTDGAANLGDARPEALKARVEQLRQQGIAFDAAGFGADGLNDRLLEQLTRNGNGRYYIVDRPEDAGTGFAKQLAGAFRPAAENVKVQVRFNPARVARYKLIGFEEHRLNKEDFRNDAVDAAEMAAEEAGVALYQIEPLPGGEGELGEVSVRFRDTTSGQMVERTWTMPYEPQASAFDQAPPSIQLASMAAFAAEKLRKAPLSDALDFKQLGKVFPGVKAKYPDSQSVSDLGGMIEKLK